LQIETKLNRFSKDW